MLKVFEKNKKTGMAGIMGRDMQMLGAREDCDFTGSSLVEQNKQIIKKVVSTKTLWKREWPLNSQKFKRIAGWQELLKEGLQNYLEWVDEKLHQTCDSADE